MSVMEGKVALVSGASSGIGKATALAFARRGAKVAVVARNQERGGQTVDEISVSGGQAELIPADLENPEDIATMVEKTLSVFGRLDFAFNNGGMVGEMALTGDQALDNWNRVIATDLTAVFIAMNYQIKAMLANGGGVIVNNSSGAGALPQPMLCPYAAAKHGVLGLTKTAAREYASQGIRVNAVCPGLIATPQLFKTFESDPAGLEKLASTLPMGKMGEPDDIANAVVWLCSDEAKYITGESLFVDGAVVCR